VTSIRCSCSPISEVIRFDAAVLASFGLPRILPDAASRHPT